MGWVIFLVYLLGWHIGLYGMFKKAAIAPWKALIPVYNTWVIVEKTGIKKIWFWMQLVPVAGQFVTLWIIIIWVMQFGKYTLWQHALAVFLPFLYLPYLGFSEKESYKGKEVVSRYKKSKAREWVDAAVFAVVAATLIRTFVFEAYNIPTGSMEKTLLVGDFLFVDKFTYGPRLPITLLSIPFLHNYLPGGSSLKSYSSAIQLPYTRWFASPVKRNDIVVFNFPAGDTVVNKPDYQSAVTYYDLVRRYGRERVLADPEFQPLAIHPIDKTDNYVKRCVAVAGDTLLIKDGIVHTNSIAPFLPPKSECPYYVQADGQSWDETVLKEEYDLDINNPDEFQLTGNPNIYRLLLTNDAKTKMKERGIKIEPVLNESNSLFPYDSLHSWTADNFGPLWIPEKGTTLTLTNENYSLYERAIRVYEHNTLERKDGRFYINGVATDRYTFNMDYYWMMGDNRHASQDSRYWGFVPEDRIVGHPLIIWMSSGDGGIRWRRLFNIIR